MSQVLKSTQTTGDPFRSLIPSWVFLETYADGWFVEYAVYRENPTEMIWKRWHNQALQQHGELSRVLIAGGNDLRFRLNGGTVGATAVTSAYRLGLFR